MATISPQRFTGRHMAAILVTFFGVVIAVNLLMARLAIGTFGGTVVDNSYVASQSFNGWLAEARDEQALGWQATVRRDSQGTVLIMARDRDGRALDGATVSAIARHPLGRLPDRYLAFAAQQGGFRSTSALGDGRWQLIVTIVRDGRTMRVAADVA